MSVVGRFVLKTLHGHFKRLSQLVVDSSAVQQLKNIEEKSLRVTVDGGGCSGFQYKFEIDEKVNNDDVVFEKDGVQIITDKISLDFIKELLKILKRKKAVPVEFHLVLKSTKIKYNRHIECSSTKT
ncbi:hypothetical protein ACHWQZ_G010557 [Mnemiopsis leidyi]